MATNIEKDIFELVLANNLEELKTLPKSWIVDQLYERRDQKSPLILACEKDFTELGVYLLECDAGSTDAITHGNDSDVEHEGWTALHYACTNQNLVLVNKLLECGANIFPEVHGLWWTEVTPLRVAAQTGNNDILDALLHQPHERTDDTLNHSIESEMIKTANVDEVKPSRVAPQTATNVKQRLRSHERTEDPVNYRILNEMIKTPIFDAVTYRHVDTVQFLLDHGAVADIIDEDRCLPLHYALEVRGRRGRAIFDLLRDKTEDVNRQDCEGDSPLHYAVSNDNVYAIRQLARRDVELSENNDGLSPVGVAVEQDSNHTLYEVLQAFNSSIDHSILVNALHIACETLHSTCLDTILNHSTTFLEHAIRSSEITETAFELATQCESASTICKLIKRGFFVSRGKQYRFVARGLWNNGGADIMRLLIEAGADCDPGLSECNSDAAKSVECEDDPSLIRFLYRHGFKQRWHECTQDHPDNSCLFILNKPDVMSLQRLAINATRNRIITVQNSIAFSDKNFVSLYAGVQQLPIPRVFKHLLVDLQINNDDDDDDDITEFDVFPVFESGSESEMDNISTTGDSDGDIDSGSETDSGNEFDLDEFSRNSTNIHRNDLFDENFRGIKLPPNPKDAKCMNEEERVRGSTSDDQETHSGGESAQTDSENDSL